MQDFEIGSYLTHKDVEMLPVVNVNLQGRIPVNGEDRVYEGPLPPEEVREVRDWLRGVILADGGKARVTLNDGEYVVVRFELRSGHQLDYDFARPDAVL